MKLPKGKNGFFLESQTFCCHDMARKIMTSLRGHLSLSMKDMVVNKLSHRIELSLDNVPSSASVVISVICKSVCLYVFVYMHILTHDKCFRVSHSSSKLHLN